MSVDRDCDRIIWFELGFAHSGGDSSYGSAISRDFAFVFEIDAAVIGDALEFRGGGGGPIGASGGGERGIGVEFEKEIVMGVGDLGVVEDDVAAARHGFHLAVAGIAGGS
jgi:hypothetical protein